MARPPFLSPEQQAAVRAFALQARAESSHRGFGSARGRVGRNSTEVIRDHIREQYGREMSLEGVRRMLFRLGLIHVRLAQGGLWREPLVRR